MSRRKAARGAGAPDEPTAAATRGGWSARDWTTVGVVAAITVVAFIPALKAGFVSWDDDKNFVDNLAWRGLGADQLRWMWTTFHLGTWIPLSWMSLGLDYAIWGMSPAGYHLTNVAIHAANAALAYALARRVFAIAAPHGPRNFGAAAFAALVFAVHPLRVESVAWITERRDVLSGFFYLVSLIAYLQSGHGESRTKWYAASLIGFVLALLSKGTAVTLPVALLILNVYPLRRVGGRAGWWTAESRRVYAGLAPFAALAGIVTIVVFTALQSEPQLNMVGKVAVSAYSLQFYLLKTIAPVGLSPLYAMPEHVDTLGATYLLSYGVVVALAAVAWSTRKRAPAVTVAIVAFAAILFPLLGVHQGGPQIAADRNTYNASLALALLAGGALLVAERRIGRAASGVAASIVVVMAGLTWRQTSVWNDSESLWSRVIEIDPTSPFGQNNYANVAMRQGRVGDAMAHYSLAIEQRPGYAEAHGNLGVALAASGRVADAVVEYRKAAELKPGDDQVQNNWGVALARDGDPAAAIDHYRLAITANPSNADAHVNWGNALVRMGKPQDAEEHYRDALRFGPDNADAHHNWGVALAQQGRLADAVREFESALALDPGHEQARAYLTRAQEMLRAPPPKAAGKSP